MTWIAFVSADRMCKLLQGTRRAEVMVEDVLWFVYHQTSSSSITWFYFNSCLFAWLFAMVKMMNYPGLEMFVSHYAWWWIRRQGSQHPVALWRCSYWQWGAIVRLIHANKCLQKPPSNCASKQSLWDWFCWISFLWPVSLVWFFKCCGSQLKSIVYVINLRGAEPEHDRVSLS